MDRAITYTPPKFNMEPENNGFQMDFPFPGTYCQVPCHFTTVKAIYLRPCIGATSYPCHSIYNHRFLGSTFKTPWWLNWEVLILTHPSLHLALVFAAEFGYIEKLIPNPQETEGSNQIHSTKQRNCNPHGGPSKLVTTWQLLSKLIPWFISHEWPAIWKGSHNPRSWGLTITICC